LNNKLRSKCGDCIQDAAILYAVAWQNHELASVHKGWWRREWETPLKQTLTR
jgi:hypothetical protein